MRRPTRRGIGGASKLEAEKRAPRCGSTQGRAARSPGHLICDEWFRIETSSDDTDQGEGGAGRNREESDLVHDGSPVRGPLLDTGVVKKFGVNSPVACRRAGGRDCPCAADDTPLPRSSGPLAPPEALHCGTMANNGSSITSWRRIPLLQHACTTLPAIRRGGVRHCRCLKRTPVVCYGSTRERLRRGQRAAGPLWP